MDNHGWSGHLVHAVREFAEMRRRELQGHIDVNKDNPEEQEWAAQELQVVDKLHTAAVNYLDETGQ